MATSSAVPHALAPARTPTIRDYLAVSLYWLALSFFWGGLLVMILPSRVQTLFGDTRKDAMLTVLSAGGATIAAISQILFGALSDGSHHPWGRRRPFLLWGTLLALPFVLLFPFAHALVPLLAVYCALQLFLNVAIGPYQALMHDLIPAERHGVAATWIGVVGLIGRIGGPLIAVLILNMGAGTGGKLSSARSETNLFYLMIVFALLLGGAMLLSMGLARETPYREEDNFTLSQRIRAVWNVPLRPYPSFVWLVVSRFGIMMGIYTVQFCLFYYVRDTLGYKTGAGDIVKNFLVLSTLTGLVGTLPAGWISDRVGRKTVLFAANIIGMGAGLCFALASDVKLAYIAAGVFGVGFGAFSAVDWALATGLLPASEPAKYMGVWGTSDTVSQVIAPLVAGPLALLINNSMGAGVGYRALMLLSLVWFALGTFALMPIKEPQTKLAEPM